MKFIDEVTIQIRSGKGGPGKVSFRREAMTPRGGPDGGDGGKGGDLVFESDERLGSLLDLRLRKEYRAEDGNPGGDQNKSGAAGKDLVIRVPPGTLVKSTEGMILADLGPKDRLVFLKGGRGGKGNAFFKTSVNQAPTHAQPGEAGQEMTVQLELKLLADVGIVGFPNAGKSTLISRISKAKPKVADYPFTTLVPNLGVVPYRDERSFVVADIPGLIEGASQGAGLGIQFLRHIERTKLFVHLIDVAPGTSDPLERYQTIRNELKLYDESQSNLKLQEGINDYMFSPLSSRTEIVVLNKIDSLTEDELDEVRSKFTSRGMDVMVISAAAGRNIQKLIDFIGQRLFGAEGT